MKIDIILGLQWGDEGKGKIVDVFTERYDVVARFQGGPNAGHTLEFDGKKHILHTIPSGIFHSTKINLIGNGVIIDPFILKKELAKLTEQNVDYNKNLYIARRTHLILPTHRLLDACLESLKGDKKIGSTLKGIGPTYTDKTARNGIRIGDIESPHFEEKYAALRDWHLRQMQGMGFDHKEIKLDNLSFEEYEGEWMKAAKELLTMNIVDGETFINSLLEQGKSILAEGAQGTLLDVDFGSYPFVTSSNTISAAVCSGLGVSPKAIGDIYGVFKAYCTRVGSGPFPTELHDETGQALRDKGHEYGSTTGRPRRCGWMDMPALRYSCLINGVTKLIMTKADVLSDFKEIKLAESYERDGVQSQFMSYHDNEEETIVNYAKLDGWKENIENLTDQENLPEALVNYISFIEEDLGIPLSHVSVGPDRKQIIELFT